MTSGSVANTISTATGSLLVNSKAAYRKAYLPGSNVWVGRLLFVSSLAAVAAVLGYFTNKFLTDSETDLAEKQYESIADRALDTAAEITLRKRLGTVISGRRVCGPGQWRGLCTGDGNQGLYLYCL
jgi:hypothetical protein